LLLVLGLVLLPKYVVMVVIDSKARNPTVNDHVSLDKQGGVQYAIYSSLIPSTLTFRIYLCTYIFHFGEFTKIHP
jgi:hypothetical protein